MSTQKVGLIKFANFWVFNAVGQGHCKYRTVFSQNNFMEIRMLFEIFLFEQVNVEHRNN